MDGLMATWTCQFSRAFFLSLVFISEHLSTRWRYIMDTGLLGSYTFAVSWLACRATLLTVSCSTFYSRMHVALFCVLLLELVGCVYLGAMCNRRLCISVYKLHVRMDEPVGG